jgi:signal transduction histidine kinase
MEDLNASNNVSKPDNVLSVITRATEIFLRGSLATWQANIFDVLRLLGHELGITRIYLCKNKQQHDDQVVTGIRYEWISDTDTANVDPPALQEINISESGYNRWIETFRQQGIIFGKVSDMPIGERGWFIGAEAKSIIAVPVFVEQEWWGFICFENYAPEEIWTSAEIDAFKTVALIFGAAIRRKRTEEALEREKKSVEQQAREIQDIARFPAEDPSPVLRISKDGVVLYANRAADPLLQSWQVTVGEHIPPHWQSINQRVFESNQTETTDVEYADQTFAVLFSPVISSDYVNLYAREVTKEREVDRMKSDFISLVSHQLRTPLTAIRWYSDKLIRKGASLDANQKEWAQDIYDTSIQLTAIVNDLLNISRLERGKIDPQLKPNDINKLINECIHELTLHAENKKITLNSDTPPIEPFNFDGELIKQVILNLISNAIKYTPNEGLVQVKTRVQDHDVIIEVIDSGIGIPQADQAAIFQRFFRAENASKQGIEGTGLGLSFAKMVVEKSGGDIWFSSTENNGSTFSFSLPLQPKVDTITS